MAARSFLCVAILLGSCFALSVGAERRILRKGGKVTQLPIPPKKLRSVARGFASPPPPAPAGFITAAFRKKAPDAKSVLVLERTNTAPQPYDSASIAAQMGYTVVIADDAQWASMSTADFKTYLAIVIGDSQCSFDLSLISAPQSTLNTWGNALSPDAGNIFIFGTDPEYHSQFFPDAQGVGAIKLIQAGISRATSVPGVTGLSLSLSCYYAGDSTIQSVVPILNYFGTFKVTGLDSCFDDAHVVAPFSAPSGTVMDSDLSNWQCSIHEIFTSISNLRAGYDFETLAIARGPLTGSQTYSDGTRGTPYILGSVPVPDVPEKDCSKKTVNSCDFYFEGYGPNQLPPTFNIGSTTGPDHSISTSILDRFTGKKVPTVNTNKGFTYGNLPSGLPTKKGENSHSFYGNRDKVFVQVFNAPINPNNYRNKCIVIPLTSVQLPNGRNLNPKDGVTAYREGRRCVIFKTAA
eukprot:TRINITY_DN15355_c0_g1_i2.p1 TRINITY_DN15355_c0_g1~~TRINITY_DN15355_c0_g1_i2.p1  ORF type:complete len:464 (+),score=54.46 TRINITY_DN15355_c0_g1_i2:78-1469(+)